MRIFVVAFVAVLVTGCVSISGEPSPSPSVVPTAPPATPTPTATPIQPTPTSDPATATPPTFTAEPSATPDPNATPAPTTIDLLPFLSSEVTVVNLADEQVALTVTLVDPDSTDEYEIGTFEIEPLQVTTQSVIPARFRLEFGFAGGASAGTCTVDIEDGEQLQFAVIESGIALTSSGAEPDDPAQMLVATADRCKAGEAT